MHQEINSAFYRQFDTYKSSFHIKLSWKKKSGYERSIPNFFDGFDVSATSVASKVPVAATSEAETSTVAPFGEVLFIGPENGKLLGAVGPACGGMENGNGEFAPNVFCGVCVIIDLNTCSIAYFCNKLATR